MKISSIFVAFLENINFNEILWKLIFLLSGQNCILVLMANLKFKSWTDSSEVISQDYWHSLQEKNQYNYFCHINFGECLVWLCFYLEKQKSFIPKKYELSQEWTGFNIKTTNFAYWPNFQQRIWKGVL